MSNWRVPRVLTGRAAEMAGRVLRSKILRLTNAGENARLCFADGCVTVADGELESRIKLCDLPMDERGYALSVEETFDPPTSPLDEQGQGAPYAVTASERILAELDVDVDLGTVRVLKITAAHDVEYGNPF
ncbi:MAG TPA: molybdopterin cofactor-binding domain-containing protein [Xanthobacteraceae bacterium]